jgi:hypothetical protein
MEMLLEAAMDSFETVNELAQIGLIASDNPADALLMGYKDLVMQLAALGGQCQHRHAPVVRDRAALDEIGSFKAIRDCRDVALISEQQATEINHGQSMGLTQVVQRPELTGAEAKLAKELTIGVIEQVEQIGEQNIETLFGSMMRRVSKLHMRFLS